MAHSHFQVSKPTPESLAKDQPQHLSYPCPQTNHDTHSFTHAKEAMQAILLKNKKNVLPSYFLSLPAWEGRSWQLPLPKRRGKGETQKCNLWLEAPLTEQLPPHSSESLLPLAGHADLVLPTEHTKRQKHHHCSQHFAERCYLDS